MADDEYTELARELLEKMREFISESEPGEALIPLHKAYAVVKTTVDAADPDSEISRRKREIEDARRNLDEMRDRSRRSDEQRRSQQDASAQERQERFERRRRWKSLDRNVKMGRVLTALSNDALIRCEIAGRISKAHPDITVYDNDLVGLLNEMLVTGELEREKEAPGPNHAITAKGGYRWRWRRRTPDMSRELQALEQRLKKA